MIIEGDKNALVKDICDRGVRGHCCSKLNTVRFDRHVLATKFCRQKVVLHPPASLHSLRSAPDHECYLDHIQTNVCM